MHIELTESPSEADARALSRGIIEFNHRAVPDLEAVEDEIRFHVFLCAPIRQTLGGLPASGTH